MWFERPSNYDCVVRNSDTQLYGYRNNVRDTFIPNGLYWQKTATSSYNTIPNGSVCLSDSPVYPSALLSPLLVSATLVVLCFFSLIIKMFMGVRR